MYVGHVPASIARAREESPLSTLSVPAPPPPLPLTSFCVFQGGPDPPPPPGCSARRHPTLLIVVVVFQRLTPPTFSFHCPYSSQTKVIFFFPLTTNLDNTMSSAAHEAIPAIPLKKQPQVQEDGAAAAAAGGEQGAAAAGGLGNDA